jgi:hypothetical protein
MRQQCTDPESNHEPGNSRRCIGHPYKGWLPNKSTHSPRIEHKQACTVCPTRRKGWADEHQVFLVTNSTHVAHVTCLLRKRHRTPLTRVGRCIMKTHPNEDPQTALINREAKQLGTYACHPPRSGSSVHGTEASSWHGTLCSALQFHWPLNKAQGLPHHTLLT